MRASAGLPILLFVTSIGTLAQAEIYKCREATGALLYTDTPCSTDAVTLAVMPKGSLTFDIDFQSDAAVEEELLVLSEQEAELINEFELAQAAPGESLAAEPEAHALRMQILAQLESVRRQKMQLLGRGLAPDQGEELMAESPQSEQ